MNKPLDPENIANENVSVENQISSSSDEIVKQSQEKVEETPVDNLIVEEISPESAAKEPLSEETPNKEAVEETLSETAEEEPLKEEPVEESPSEETVEETLSEIAEEEPLKEEPVEESLSQAAVEEPKSEEVEKEPKPEIEIPTSKAGVIDVLTSLVEKDMTETLKNNVELLKQTFYKLKRNETEEAKKAFLEAGGLEDEFKPTEDELEEQLKELLAVFREKKASLVASSEKQKEDNLEAKKSIIEKIKVLSENTDEDFYKIYNEFRKLQQEWKEIKQIPQSAVNALWKEYQFYSEKFYDLLKINNEMRDYDFKKNLELKQTLCESVEKLDVEKDVISAFYQLQKLHQDWREIGPVAKELREETWNRFKKASSVINKKHQEHFEALRNLEQRNLDEKTTICEELEALDCSKLISYKDWDEQNKRVLELQEKWRMIGYAPKKQNVKIFERFRAACDSFFQNKSNFYKSIKDSMEDNLEKKKALCEKAEALKDSQEWKETTDKMIALQKEWKSTGSVSRKHSDAIWRRFISACDYFFEQKNKHFSSQKSEEQDNLKKKKDIIVRVNAIDESLSAAETVAIIREMMTEWNAIGFVPFRDKDKIYKEYHQAIDKHFDRLKIDESERRLQSFKSNLSDFSTKGEKTKNKLLNERDKLMRTYERLKNDIQTYENNIGFLSVSSKGGGGLVKEMNRKIETLKEELDLIVKKIELIDENFDGPKQKE